MEMAFLLVSTVSTIAHCSYSIIRFPDLNLPITGVAAVLVLLFVNLKVPEGTMTEKLRRIDWMWAALTRSFQIDILIRLCSGTFIIVSSTVSFAIGLTWGGVVYAWSSARVLVPLILGAVGILAFFVFESLWAQNPIVSESLRKRVFVFESSLFRFLIICYQIERLWADTYKTLRSFFPF